MNWIAHTVRVGVTLANETAVDEGVAKAVRVAVAAMVADVVADEVADGVTVVVLVGDAISRVGETIGVPVSHMR